MLTCDYDWDPKPGAICWTACNKIAPCDRKRATKCRSCNNIVRPGELSAKFKRWKIPECEIERKIYGEEYENGPPRAPYFLCLDCANIYFFLCTFQYAININENMHDLAKEHAELIRDGHGGCL